MRKRGEECAARLSSRWGMSSESGTPSMSSAKVMVRATQAAAQAAMSDGQQQRHGSIVTGGLGGGGGGMLALPQAGGGLGGMAAGGMAAGAADGELASITSSATALSVNTDRGAGRCEAALFSILSKYGSRDAIL